MLVRQMLSGIDLKYKNVIDTGCPPPPDVKTDARDKYEKNKITPEKAKESNIESNKNLEIAIRSSNTYSTTNQGLSTVK